MESVRLTTNYIPSDEEIKDIRQHILLRSEELARLDERIRNLSAERDEIRAYIDSQKALISHPRRLPADVVQEIFIACLPTTRNAVMSTKEAPLLLCRICSAWRTIALSTPRLWASLHAPLDFILLKESRISAVTQWLQRSAACPISISICDGSPWEWGIQALPTPCRDALTRSLCAVANRWRHAKFDTISVEMANELTDITSPLLESVEFSGRIPTPNQLKFFQVPNLRTVTLHLDDSESLNAVLTMPLMWNRLQYLTITRISFSDLIILLERCQELISLIVTPFIDSVPDPFPTETILPFLASFRILGSGFILPHFLGQLTSHLSVPGLRQFAVPAATCQYGPQDSFFLVSLGKKSPFVEDLTIYLPSLTAQSLPETLRAFSSLARLVVFDVNTWAWDKDGFQSCTVTLLLTVLSDSATCSMLQELVIHDCDSLDYSKSTLDEFIRQRMERAHPLRRLEISFQWPESLVLDLMSETEIRSYRLQGLDISLRWQNATPWGRLIPLTHGRAWGQRIYESLALCALYY
ncbi:hypothetical protein MSAN_00095000 [Mycena sanguinolenta]|uniref:F-box domain-containing protein n=1 Tax=Mycena sanguinolenta TaxID=230812 RepID=A0A8H6ZG37_9AGAR|nr:hypothetical protein MSAN_00095000 [Mycena sanguinolenta]